MSVGRINSNDIVCYSAAIAAVIALVTSLNMAFGGDFGPKLWVWSLGFFVFCITLKNSFKSQTSPPAIHIFISTGLVLLLVDASATTGVSSEVTVFSPIITVLAAVLLRKRHIVIYTTMLTFGMVTIEIVLQQFTHALNLVGYIGTQTLLSIVFFKFVSLHTELNDKLMAEKQNLESVLSILNHDIANSVMVVQFAGEKLAAEMAGNQKHISKVIEHSDKIVRLIRTARAIQASRVMGGGIPTTTISIASLLDQLKSDFSRRLTLKNIELKLELPIGEEHLAVKANEPLFSACVLDNLLSNAIKFSHQNSTIIVSVQLEGEYVSISVRDFGIGVPSDLAPTLFELHASTSRRGTDGEVGTGFGLPNVQFTIRKMGGVVKFVEPGSNQTGSEFVVTLPKAS